MILLNVYCSKKKIIAFHAKLLLIFNMAEDFS